MRCLYCSLHAGTPEDRPALAPTLVDYGRRMTTIIGGRFGVFAVESTEVGGSLGSLGSLPEG